MYCTTRQREKRYCTTRQPAFSALLMQSVHKLSNTMNNIWDAIPFRENGTYWLSSAEYGWNKKFLKCADNKQCIWLCAVEKASFLNFIRQSKASNGMGMALFLFGIWPLVTTAFAPLLLLGAVLTKNVVRSPANYRWIWHGGWMTLLGVKIWAMVLVHLNKRTPRLGILYVYYSNHLNFISHITTQCHRELIFI